MIENFSFDPMWLGPDSEPVEADFFAHIPQDFNLDIHTSGNILGVNPGDSKLLAMECDLRALRGSINVKRVKAENCHLEAHQQIKIGSSLESHNLSAKAGKEGFFCAKRLGIGQRGSIESEGKIRISSAFSNMRALPQVNPA